MTDGLEKKAEIREQIEYDILCQQYDRMQLDELVEIMLEVAMNRSPTVKIGRDAEYPLKVLSHRTEFLYRTDLTPDYSLPYYCTEFIFEKNYQIKFVHSIGHIQHMSNHKEYIQ